MALPYKKGSSGPEIKAWQEWCYKNFSSYAELIGPKDSYYGLGEVAFTNEMQSRLKIAITGTFDQHTADLVGYKPGSVSAPVPTPNKRRKIWIYTAPGSGADWWLGPSFDLGNRCKDVLKINHQPLSFQKGGYLGFMGGDPSFSYNEVIYDQYKSLEYCLDHNPDINDPELEIWASGYSQSEDGMEDAFEILFGDGGFKIPATGEITGPGKYRHLRSRINGIVGFGNPSTKGTGIARKVRPSWLDDKIYNINYTNDFYAVAQDAIRPPMYAIIVQSEMELPFFIHVLRLAARIVPEWLSLGTGAGGGGALGGLLGGVLGGGNAAGGAFGQLGQLVIGGMTGLGGNPLFGQMLGMAGGPSDTKVDDDIYNLLKPTGVLRNIPGLVQLVAALPGLQAHGNYPFDPVMMDKAYDHIASFRR